ncbi:HK97 family phage prohead protease [Rathayibacter sp. AY1B7]|uniref:HK97 family phage prohead protease n=1 Tax=Rathayibacter sp. AY1B7 TaxID=2080532 RepID=UPI000CE82F52|nr:HK97 family phage prohead protease [Rathayibacter sp. AY1B7]PPH99724.1 HK97 family phage prohead protease [Rathayibacter sp. AY1B7]
METKTVPVNVKAGPDDGLAEGEFIVYPSTFTRTPDSYGDIVAKGAFLDTIAEWEASGNALPGLFGHRLDDPDFYVAEALEMSEDDHGWRVRGKFDLDSPKGPQVYRLVKGRRLSQLSFAYDVLDEGTVELEDGAKANELRKLKVYEFSFVPIGANQDTSVVAVKANAEALVDAAKAGRTLSAKNEGDIRSAVDLLSNVLATLPTEDTEKASGQAPAKSADDEEPHGAKSPADEEPSVNPSAKSRSRAATVALRESTILLSERSA